MSWGIVKSRVMCDESFILSYFRLKVVPGLPLHISGKMLRGSLRRVFIFRLHIQMQRHRKRLCKLFKERELEERRVLEACHRES